MLRHLISSPIMPIQRSLYFRCIVCDIGPQDDLLVCVVSCQLPITTQHYDKYFVHHQHH